MKSLYNKVSHKDTEYLIVFNLNVMETIQDKYGTLEKWGELTDGKHGEWNASALKFGLCAMFNEGVEILNDEDGGDRPRLTQKQVARIISDIGYDYAASVMQDTVIKSTQGGSKNE